jgi:hypothetical protein
MFEEDEGPRHDNLLRRMLLSLTDSDCLTYEADLPEAIRPEPIDGHRPDIVLETLAGPVLIELKMGSQIFTADTREELEAFLYARDPRGKVVLVVPEDSFIETAQELETWGLNHRVWLAPANDWIP